MRKADGKPLAEIVRSMQQALYSGEYKDTTGLAEREEVNADKINEQRVFHGSGADFDAFDHRFMSSGEGNQSYGWGTYVTQVEGIGRKYAEAIGDARGASNYKGMTASDIRHLSKDSYANYGIGSELQRIILASIISSLMTLQTWH